MNTNNQDYRILNNRQEADNAIHSLKGILLGMTIDGEINEHEIGELRQWASEHKNLINKNPFREFIISIEEMAQHNLPSKEALEDLYWLTQKYEGDNYYFNSLTSDLKILQGICHGILSDGKINDREIVELNKWLDYHEHLSTYYPYDEIKSLLVNVLSDGKIVEEEKKTLKAYFNQFIKLHDTTTTNQIRDEISEVKISGLCTSNPIVSFHGKTFCITGVLKSGNRADIENDIKTLGGQIVDSITKNTDYLIIGDNGNPAWAYSCYGRKVEEAVLLRKEGHNIMLIHEFDFVDILDDVD